jgi:multidrug efflux pump subunit AcrB
MTQELVSGISSYILDSQATTLFLSIILLISLVLIIKDVDFAKSFAIVLIVPILITVAFNGYKLFKIRCDINKNPEEFVQSLERR